MARPYAILLSLACLALSSCAGGRGGELSRSSFLLGTTCSIRLFEGGSPELIAKAFARVAEIEDRMSANREGTEIDRLNAMAGKEAVALSPDSFLVLKRALFFAEKTGGAFDPTIGPLVKLWGIGTEAARVPSGAEIEAARALVGWRGLTLDEAASTAYLSRAGMRVDLGAIAKGYSADEAVRILREGGARSGIVDFGGNIYAFGKKPDGSPWRVGIQSPRAGRGDYLGIVTIGEGSLVTSGDYERFFEEGGRHYHHILDQATGYPAASGLIQTTIVAASSMDADGLSTSLFLLGREKGLALAESLGAEAIVVDSDRAVWMTKGVAKDFVLVQEAYKMAE